MQDTPGIYESLKERLEQIVGKDLSKRQVENIVELFAPDDRIDKAIGFANFIGDRPLPEYSKSTNKWRWWNNYNRDYEYSTTEELYEIYLQSLNQ